MLIRVSKKKESQIRNHIRLAETLETDCTMKNLPQLINRISNQGTPGCFWSLCIVLTLTFSTSQGQEFKWALGYGPNSGTNLDAMATDTQGNVFLTGSTFAPLTIRKVGSSPEVSSPPDDSGFGIYLTKCRTRFSSTVSTQILPQWMIFLKGAPFSLKARSVAVDAEGYCYLAGEFHDSISVGGITLKTWDGGLSGFLAKFDAKGVLVWLIRSAGGRRLKTIGPVRIDPSGQPVVLGRFYGSFDDGDSLRVGDTTYHFNNTDPKEIKRGSFIAKFDKNGKLIWTTNIQTDESHQHSDGPTHALAIDVAGDIVVAGHFYDLLPTSIGSFYFRHGTLHKHLFIAKYSSAGVFQWVRDIGHTLNWANINSIKPTSHGTYLIAGFYTDSLVLGDTTLRNANGNSILAEINSDGNRNWIRTEGNEFKNLETDVAGNIYVTAILNTVPGFSGFPGEVPKGLPRGHLAQYSNQGTLQWVKLTNPLVPTMLLAIADSTVLLGSGTYSNYDSVSLGGLVYSRYTGDHSVIIAGLAPSSPSLKTGRRAKGPSHQSYPAVQIGLFFRPPSTWSDARGKHQTIPQPAAP